MSADAGRKDTKKGGGDGGKKRKATAAGDALDQDRGTVQKRRGLFAKELRPMMYGYGDTAAPLQETVDLVEDITIEYVTTLAHKAMEQASKHGKLSTEDIIFLVRKDPRKFARVKELLTLNEELKDARKILHAPKEEDLVL